MDTYAGCIVLALLGEAIVENLKIIYDNGKFKMDKIIALAICCLITTFSRCDVFSLLGINFLFPVVGQLFTGILISRGAGAFHDVINLVQQKK